MTLNGVSGCRCYPQTRCHLVKKGRSEGGLSLDALEKVRKCDFDKISVLMDAKEVVQDLNKD